MAPERARLSDLKRRDAFAVVIGWSALAPALAQLLFGTADLGVRLETAWTVGVLGLMCLTVGIVRAYFWLPTAKRGPVWHQWLSVAFGVFALAMATTPLDWHYLPSDPRSQPGAVLASVFFVGFFGVVALVVGAVLSVSAALKRWRPGG